MKRAKSVDYSLREFGSAVHESPSPEIWPSPNIRLKTALAASMTVDGERGMMRVFAACSASALRISRHQSGGVLAPWPAWLRLSIK